MNTYLVSAKRIYVEKIIVTAASEEEARQKVLDDDYDDCIDSDPCDILEDGMTIQLDEVDVEDEG